MKISVAFKKFPFLILFFLIFRFGYSQVVDFHPENNNQSVVLDGIWSFTPGKLNFDSTNYQNVEVPLTWKKQGFSDINNGVYQIQINKKGKIAPGLKVPDVNGALEVWVNGHLAFSKGTISLKLDEFSAERKTALINLEEYGQSPYIIQLKVSTYFHTRPGITESITLGDYNFLGKRKRIETAFEFFLCGSLLIGSFFFLGLFINGRKEKMSLYFSLFCIVYAYRTLGAGNYTLHDFVEIPHWLGIRLEYASLYLAGVFFALYVWNLFPNETPKKIIKIFIGISIAYCVSTLLPINVFTRFNYSFLAILIVGIVLMILIYSKAILNDRVGGNYALYATMFIMMVFVLKILSYLEYINDPYYLSLSGEIAFFCLQGVLLSSHFSHTWQQALLEARQANEKLLKTQTQLIESEKMASLGLLTAGLAHEINNPLNFIGGVIDPLKDDVKELVDLIENDKRKETKNQDLFLEIENLLNGIASGSKRATGIIKNLLEITPKKTNSENEVVNLYELINSSLLLIRKGNSDVRFSISGAKKLFVFGNATELNQVFLNIIRNSLDALKNTQTPSISIDTCKKNDNIQVEIKDNGAGFEQDVVDHIFDPFFTTKEKGSGTGLGLYISRSIIMKHGGSIEAENHSSGARFTIILPTEKSLAG